jgi:arylsulfatase A-like enzyme
MTGTHPVVRSHAALRGLLVGLGAGSLWIGLEVALAWTSGSVLPTDVWMTIGSVDVVVGAVLGVATGALAPAIGAGRVAVVVTCGWAFMRVFAPPGLGSEAGLLVLAAGLVWGAARLIGRDHHRLFAALHTSALMAAGLLVGELLLDSSRAGTLRGVALPVGVAGLLALGPLADQALRLAVRTRPTRFALQVTVAALAMLLWGRPLAVAPYVDPVVTAVPPEPGPPDVFLVSLDTTRADHLSTYGYERDTSPNLTRFAQDARLYRWARSTAAWTLPGHASMMTGLFPSSHGAHLTGGFVGGESIDGRRNVAFPLAAEHTTLAELLRDRGYRTAAFVGNFSYLYRDYGLAQGFGLYDDAPGVLLRIRPPAVSAIRYFVPGFALKPFRTARQISELALGWLDAQPQDRPVFVFMNFMEPHQPWHAEAPFDDWARAVPGAHALARKNLYTHAAHDVDARTAAFIQANYDGQIAAMDEALGRFLAGLRARARYQNSLIVVTADHGELLGEHSEMGHMGRTLYEPLVRIPLVVKHPGPEGIRGVSDRPVQLVDVMPTVAQVVGAAVPDEVEGTSLEAVTRPSFAEAGINPFLVSEYGPVYDRAMRVVYDGSRKLITTSRGERMLFDLASDPGEERNIAEAEPEQTERLLGLLEGRVKTTLASADATRRVQ